jgi:8-oxo-dGTP diphosphatase
VQLVAEFVGSEGVLQPVGQTALVTTVIVGAALVRDGKLLAQQRAWPVEADGQWELPGGRVEPGESDAFALARECCEELDVVIVVGERVGEDVPLPGGKLLRIYAASLVSPGEEPRAVEHRAVRWLGADDLDDVDWLPADRLLLPAFRALLTS